MIKEPEVWCAVCKKRADKAVATYDLANNAQLIAVACHGKRDTITRTSSEALSEPAVVIAFEAEKDAV